jgi:dihydroorotate dehydrogenase
MVNLYERLLRPVLFSLDPETVHHVAIGLLRVASVAPWALAWLAPKGRCERDVFGVHFPNPVGLAAGFDKNAVALPAWAALGFGFVEAGTVTAQPQPGNPRPRIFRISELEAIINRLGFNNEGVERIAARLEELAGSGRWPKIPVGINLGKTKVVPLERAVDDYLAAFKSLNRFGDYIVLNVSSPNTPGLRKLQEREAIAALFGAVQAQNPGKPLLVKIAPDLIWTQLDDVLGLAGEHRLAGIIATNTTVDQASVPADLRQEGGLSGRPLAGRSLELLRHIKQNSPLPVISVGGIMTGDDAKARFDAGADLIQIYTGFIYRGPRLVREAVAAAGEQ